MHGVRQIRQLLPLPFSLRSFCHQLICMRQQPNRPTHTITQKHAFIPREETEDLITVLDVQEA